MRDRREIYHDILEQGLLTIRAYATSDAEQCQIEADHLHNIPELLTHFDLEVLHEFYWNTMRTGYVRRSKPGYPERYEALWQQLEEANKAAAKKIANDESTATKEDEP